MGSENINILLSDDDKDDCLFFKEALEELNLPARLTTLYNGEQLMRHLAEKANPLPDVLFLDLNMPRKNGFTCLEEIKRSEKLKALPVVIISTSYDELVADRLYQNGAHYFICKPADFSQLKKVIQQAISLTLKKNSTQPPKENFLLSNLMTVLF